MKTVATKASECGAEQEIAVALGTDVTYCYTVTNNSPITVTDVTLMDDHLGDLTSLLPSTTLRGDPFNDSAEVKKTVPIFATTVNVATVEAVPQEKGMAMDGLAAQLTTVTATSSATVVVPGSAAPALGTAALAVIALALAAFGGVRLARRRRTVA